MLAPLDVAAEIGPKEFQNQLALPIRSLAFSPVDGRQNPVSGSMSAMSNCWFLFTYSLGGTHPPCGFPSTPLKVASFVHLQKKLQKKNLQKKNCAPALYICCWSGIITEWSRFLTWFWWNIIKGCNKIASLNWPQARVATNFLWWFLERTDGSNLS